MWELLSEYWVNFLFTSMFGILSYFAKKAFNIFNEKMAVINEIQKQIDEIKKDSIEQRKLKAGLIRGLHHSVYYMSELYTEKGYITTSELKNITYLYEAYKDIGGNGAAKIMYEKCINLPIKEKEVD